MNQSNLLTVRVAGVMNRQAVVLHAGRTLPCLLSGRLLRQKDSLAVGDRAEAEVLGGGQYRLTRILPRTSALRRPSRRGSGDALLAANADFVLAVCAAPSLLRAFALPEWALEAARAGPPGSLSATGTGWPRRRETPWPAGWSRSARSWTAWPGAPPWSLPPGFSPPCAENPWPCWAARGAARPP